MKRIIFVVTFFGATAIAMAAEPLPALPNHSLTPGLARSDLSLATICNTKWGKDARHVSDNVKKQVFAEYGLSGNRDPACIPNASGQRCEIDHLISRELGGAGDIKNLWPQPYGSEPWNAHRKDCVENRLNKAICKDRSMTLEQAQEAIRSDWTAVYLRYYEAPQADEPKCIAKKSK